MLSTNDCFIAIVAANNHYSGFGLETASMFRKMLNLSEVTWSGVEIPTTREKASHNIKELAY